ncbi:MAG: hypothetical protein M3O50_12375, partial [Myxococcota bacterium]|nr:hypothetical protein [Myxococcota bacterium]
LSAARAASSVPPALTWTEESGVPCAGGVLLDEHPSAEDPPSARQKNWSFMDGLRIVSPSALLSRARHATATDYRKPPGHVHSLGNCFGEARAAVARFCAQRASKQRTPTHPADRLRGSCRNVPSHGTTVAIDGSCRLLVICFLPLSEAVHLEAAHSLQSPCAACASQRKGIDR